MTRTCGDNSPKTAQDALRIDERLRRMVRAARECLLRLARGLKNDLPFETFVESFLLIEPQLDIGTKSRVEGLEFLRMPRWNSQQPLVALAQAGLDIALAGVYGGKDAIAEDGVTFVAGRHNDQKARRGQVRQTIDLTQGDKRIGVVFGCGNVATVKTGTGYEGKPISMHKGFCVIKTLTGIKKIKGVAQDLTVIARGHDSPPVAGPVEVWTATRTGAGFRAADPSRHKETIPCTYYIPSKGLKQL